MDVFRPNMSKRSRVYPNENARALSIRKLAVIWACIVSMMSFSTRRHLFESTKHLGAGEVQPWLYGMGKTRTRRRKQPRAIQVVATRCVGVGLGGYDVRRRRGYRNDLYETGGINDHGVGNDAPTTKLAAVTAPTMHVMDKIAAMFPSVTARTAGIHRSTNSSRMAKAELLAITDTDKRQERTSQGLQSFAGMLGMFESCVAIVASCPNVRLC